MKVTYIHHSSFCVEIEDCVFLFDYFEGDIPQFDDSKKIFVLSSHMHQDHFDFKIFELSKQYSHVNYILSKDIKDKYNRKYMEKRGVSNEALDSITFIKENESLTLTEDKEGLLGDLKVETLNSTDEGVAFILSYQGKTMYHAGDLHWWTWIGETNEDYEEMKECYSNEIKKIEGRHFDAAMVVLDPRLKDRFWWGFDLFMKATDTTAVFPMHFWKDYSVIKGIKELPCSEGYRDSIMELEYENQEFAID